MLKINVLITVSLLGLSACGGSSGSKFENPTILDGVFKDSNVSGLLYKSGAEEGITDEKGAFKYEDGQKVNFSIGKVDLGSGAGQSVMTPLDLVEDGSLKSAEVINKVRFLMMLDEDNNPGNGIVISKKVQEKAETWATIDFKSADFPTEAVHGIVTSASVADSVEHFLPNNETAATHLKTTLLCANAGAYVGSYSGTESGNIALMVDPVTGEVNGSSYNSANEVSVEVKSTSALDYDKGLEFISTEDSAKAFTGTLSSVDKLGGSWVDSADILNKGIFSGERIGGKSDAVYRYTVAYTGDADKGLFTFDIDEKNIITGTAYSISTKKDSGLSGSVDDGTLTVMTEDGNKLTGFIKDDFALDGVWINSQKKTDGSFAGGGCKLN